MRPTALGSLAVSELSLQRRATLGGCIELLLNLQVHCGIRGSRALKRVLFKLRERNWS
jgi:hypothetical protein